MGRPRKALITNLKNTPTIPSSPKLSDEKSPETSVPSDPLKAELEELGNSYAQTKEETDAKGNRPTKYRVKKAEAEIEAEKKREDIQATGDAFGDTACMLLDMWFRRMREPQPLTDFEKASMSKATSRCAVKYIGVEFKYKEEIVLLTVAGGIIVPRLMK